MAQRILDNTKPRGESPSSGDFFRRSIDPRRLLRSHRGLAGVITVALVTLTMPAMVRADSVKLSGFWHDNVAVEAVVDGQLVYRTAAGRRVERSLTAVEGLKLDRYPALAEAEEAREAGEHERAATQYRRVLNDVRETDVWVGHYVRGRLVRSLDELHEPVEAVRMYVALVGAEVDAGFLVDPPVASVRRADAEQQQQLAAAIESVIGDADAATRQSLEQLRDLLDRDPATAADDDADAPESAVVLPAGIENDQATQHLRRGDFDTALEAAERTLSSSGGLSMGLYQKALAQLAKADADNDESLMKTAGLNFMRVVVYFPRSRYVGPALVEAGYIHARLGRTELALSLYDRARLRIDEEEDPAYYQRLMTLREQLQ